MPSERLRVRLLDIRDAIRDAQNFSAGLSAEQFLQDRKTIFAVVRALEIISEASRHVDEVKARHPHLPWSDIAGAGNVYRHDYPTVRADLVWNTVQTALPPLLAAVETELAREP